MTDPVPALPSALALDADRGKLRAALRRNTVLLAVYAGLCLLVVGGIVALAVTDFGRLATYFLLGLLLVVLLGNVGLVWWLRRRIRRYQRAADPVLLLSDQALVVAGIPPVPWADVLGVIYLDERAALGNGGRIARWFKRLTYRAGGGLVGVHIGVDRPRRFREGAAGGLSAYLSSSFDLGGIVLPLETAFSDAQLTALRDALRALAAADIIRLLESDDPRRTAKAAGAMGSGKPMPRDV